MPQPVYDNINTDGSWDMNGHAKRNRTHQHTGSDSVRNRSSRAAAVCLVLLCVLLLTAVIVLGIRTKSTNYTEERNILLNEITNLTEERDELSIKNKNLTNERDQLIFTIKALTSERDRLRNELQIYDGWTYYQSRFYYISKEKKNWTESRRYCTERGADLIIINNREKQDFVKNMSGSAVVYIGLTDSDVEKTWKWVDGSTLTSGFWPSGEPDGGTAENCVVNAPVSIQEWANLVGWHDVACNRDFKWICEKSLSELMLP